MRLLIKQHFAFHKDPNLEVSFVYAYPKFKVEVHADRFLPQWPPATCSMAPVSKWPLGALLQDFSENMRTLTMFIPYERI